MLIIKNRKLAFYDIKLIFNAFMNVAKRKQLIVIIYSYLFLRSIFKALVNICYSFFYLIKNILVLHVSL